MIRRKYRAAAVLLLAAVIGTGGCGSTAVPAGDASEAESGAEAVGAAENGVGTENSGEVSVPVYDSALAYEELTAIYAQKKEENPSSYPLYLSADMIGDGYDISSCFIDYSCPWDDLAFGVIMDSNPDTVVNLFATEEFYTWLLQAKTWYDMGYILPDAATTSVSAEEAYACGEIGGTLRLPDRTAEAFEISEADYDMGVYIAVSNCIREYQIGLETGTIRDMEQEYSDFLEDLQKNGMDRLIEAAQKTLDRE